DPNTGRDVGGENSFTDGAGRSRRVKMSAFIKNNMPPGEDDALTDQESAELAAYILPHDRPGCEGHETDWLDGGRPTDIMDEDRRERIREGTFDWTEIENVVPSED